jgi:hypothetical protein
VGHYALLDDIAHTVKVDQQAVARRQAFEKYQQALAAADDEWTGTLRQDRGKQQLDQNAAIERERRVLDDAAARQAAAKDAAEAVYQQSLKQAQAKLTSALKSIPEAAAAQAESERRRQAVEEDCRVRESALFEAFRAVLNALSA